MQQSPTSRRTVLLVDDDEDSRFLYATALDRAGIQVLLASSASEGIARAIERHPDLVLMDLALPDMDGEAATRAIQSDPRSADMPIVAITARVTRLERSALLAAGFADVLCKPIYPTEVVTAIHARLALTTDERAPSVLQATGPR